MNNKFGISERIGAPVRECTPELLREAIQRAYVKRICQQLAQLLESFERGEIDKKEYEKQKGALKRRLPFLTPHATFVDGERKNEKAIPSRLSMQDVDHIADPYTLWQSIAPRATELGICMAHITPSGRGLRLLFISPEGMDPAQAQQWMAQEIGLDTYDSCVKDYARCSFLVPQDYVLWLDEENLFTPTSAPVPRADYTPSPLVKPTVQPSEQPQTEAAPMAKQFPQEFKGIPYASIIMEWFRRNGGEPQTGERNTKLHQLASHLRYITDNNEAHLLEIMPTYGLDEAEMRSLIHSACISKFYGTPRAMKQLLADMQGTPLSDTDDDTAPEKNTPGADTVLSFQNSEVPPPMPKRLPALVRHLLKNTPQEYKPAVAHAIFPPLGTHLHNTHFRYIDNVLHEATLMNVLMAGTGAGKSCTSEPIRRIMQDIRERDSQNLRQEREWKEEVQTKGANKDKRKRPKVCVQYIDADMTNAAFVQRMADADGRFLYTSVNEIDLFNNLQSSPRSGSQFQIMCLAFDPGNEYGQTRVGTQSVSEKICIRYNWNASTTIKKGQEYFSSVLTDGPISRINFCTIPERPIGASMPVYGEYDYAYDDELRTYIDRLNVACGEVVCKPARKLARKLAEECARQAVLSQNRAYENLSFRANVIAYLKACILYVAHGEKWDKSIEDFVRWSLHYDLWCKMHFFGDAIEREMSTPRTKPQRGPQNLLSLLPDTFTRQQAADLRIQQGIRTGTLKGMLGNWKSRGYIEEVSKAPDGNIGAQLFAKTEDYLQNRA